MAITVTEKAAGEVRHIIADQQQSDPAFPGRVFLRLRIVGGGCSGFQPKLDLDPEYSEQRDEMFDCSRRAGRGGQAQPDVPERRHRGLPRRPQSPRLRITNPSAKSTCGCGSSFFSM